MIKRGALFGGVIAFLALTFSFPTFADDNASSKFSVDVNSVVLELSIPAEPAVINLNPTASGAAFGTASLNIGVATNNATGYTLTMTPQNNVEATSLIRTELIDDEEDYRTIPTLTQTNPASTGYTEESFIANSWGYRIVSNGNYYGIPISSPTITPAAWSIVEPTNGNVHTITLAAKVDFETASGSYATTLNFRAVTNPNVPRDTIVFNGNGADGGSMENQIIWQDEATNLNANAYTRTNYFFNGWNTYADGGGEGYGDEDSFTSAISASSKTITLYAQWVQDTGQGSGYVGKTIQDAYEMAYVTNTGNFPKDGGGYKHGLYVPEKDPETGEYNGRYFEATKQSDYDGIPAKDLRFAIQDIAMTIDGVKVCDYATVIGSTANVLDLRDFTSYRIIKANDGRCWMQDDLALDPTLPQVQPKLTPETTNASQAAIDNYLTGTSPQTGWATMAVSTRNGSYYAYADSLVYVAAKGTIIQDSYDSLRVEALEGKWKTGVYYTFCAATAGTYCYASGQGPNIAIENDVCPSGWRLPTGNGGEYWNLLQVYPNVSGGESQYTRIRKALLLPLSGHTVNGPTGQGRYGRFWSTSFYNWTSMDYLSLNYGGLAYISSDGRCLGMPIRCIAK